MDTEKLITAMKAKGIKAKEMQESLGMSRTAFYRKSRGISEFTLSEIQKICEILQLDSPVGIFFNVKVS